MEAWHYKNMFNLPNIQKKKEKKVYKYSHVFIYAMLRHSATTARTLQRLFACCYAFQIHFRMIFVSFRIKNEKKILNKKQENIIKFAKSKFDEGIA